MGGDFAGWPVWGWLSPGGIPCLNPVFRLGSFGSRGPHREATAESDLDEIASGRENDGNRRSQLLGDQY